MDDFPSMSRARNPALDATELQVSNCPKVLVDFLDAMSLARGQKSRGPLVIEILEAWVQQRAREMVAVQRVVGNPGVQELARMDSE